ncbi:class I SAM-dependent methyltransferase [Aliarcobacter cryaerophilus]|uniref:class I SAM-dependent methyltransferase n=1 Tax=Aliarcobacter cryaerophilus TaxID=28198 RepID=UPI001654A3EE|nr:class I SAM-dependent methyltransferase [Aliarcobacter cryaerophilus]QNM91538.1 class I SAM-dependent methyltransferase [Aliarcobacter cryaerophilus]
MIYKYLPYFIFKPLFGDRKRCGLKTNFEDKDFRKWQDECCLKFYEDNQKGSIGTIVNHFGFKIMSQIDLTDKVVLEVGPGRIDHLDYNQTKPKKYILSDINKDFLEISKNRLKEYCIDNSDTLEVQGTSIPIEDNSVDVLVTFHQLEHIYELEEYLQELKRILKPNGVLIGAVPAEGGVAWGFGRFLTSRRYVRKNMDFDYDKIICWEHPNFVNKIKKLLDENFTSVKSIKKPFGVLPMDFNLSWSFIYRNDK